MAATCGGWQPETENVNRGGGWIADSGGWRFGWWFLGEVPLFYAQLESKFFRWTTLSGIPNTYKMRQIYFKNFHQNKNGLKELVCYQSRDLKLVDNLKKFLES